MRCNIQSGVLITSVVSICLQWPGSAWGQGLRSDREPTTATPPSIIQQSTHQENILLPDDTTKREQDGSEVEEAGKTTDSGEQAAVNNTNANPSDTPSEPILPIISAILFDGPPGPKDCRGSAVLKIELPRPGSQHATPICYNIPSRRRRSQRRVGSGGVAGVAQCGNFLANKDDGCEARVFTEADCNAFSNVAVFVPEAQAFGGYMRSVEVRCGVVGVTPPPLRLPGLELPAGAVQAVG